MGHESRRIAPSGQVAVDARDCLYSHALYFETPGRLCRRPQSLKGPFINCPVCRSTLGSVQYEGIDIETCDRCGGEWLDGNELNKITRIREEKFNAEEQRAIAESTWISGVKMADLDKGLECSGCGWAMETINYGGNSGIIIDRCTGCGGFWLDGAELEKVQMVVEGWEDALPDDLKKYGAMLRDIEAKWDKEDDVTVSRLPLVGGFINMCVNGILDITL